MAGEACSLIQAFASVVQIAASPGVLGQAEAVRAMGEHVHGVRNIAGRERGRESVGVLGMDVRVLRGVPDEEGRRLRGYQRIQ